MEHEDLGETTSIDVINGLVSLAGQTVIDIGCGDLTFTRQLADQGAHALGVDPDARQAERNRAAGPIPNVDFVEADSTALPFPDRSADGVFFSFSLHHVPAALYPRVFAEVSRVLRPDGYLCVIEPTQCPLYEVMSLFHDEDHVRAEAQRALVELAVPMFESHAVFRYFSVIRYDSFEAYASRFSGHTFNTGYTEADVRRPAVEEAFERLGAPDYRFDSPKTMMFLRGIRSS